MKRWKIINKSPISSVQLPVEEIIKTLLNNRGIKTKKDKEEFLNPKLENVTIDKVGIDKKQLKKAVARINRAIKKGEGIIIYGDYDVDGVCGTAILWETIYQVYKNVLPYIPNRVEEGYGLSIKGIQNVILNLFQDPNKTDKIGLIITVDNGIVANHAVGFANKQGIDVIITDHHVLPKIIPKAFSIVHTVNICGAGLAWAVAREFRIQNSELRIKDGDDHLELVALATVADLVPLIGASRTLVKFGLKVLSQTKRPGLLSLLEISGIKKEELGTYEVGYILGPRLNAMGRLFNAMDSLRLICTKDKTKARFHAEKLNLSNRERQNLTEETTSHAKSFWNNTSLSKIVFVYHKEYHQGIIGLVASKLVEEYYKPSFVLSVGGELTKGSARSVAGVNIIELIRSAGADLLIDAGGHPMAAGFTIRTDKIKDFQKALEEKADGVIDEELLRRTVVADMMLDLRSVSFDLYNKIQDLAPFGIANPQPVFISEKVLIEDMRLVGNGGKHVKLTLSQKLFKFDAIAFGMGDKAKDFHIGDKIDIIYTIDEDRWNGNKKLQLKIKDLKVT